MDFCFYGPPVVEKDFLSSVPQTYLLLQATPSCQSVPPRTAGWPWRPFSRWAADAGGQENRQGRGSHFLRSLKLIPLRVLQCIVGKHYAIPNPPRSLTE